MSCRAAATLTSYGDEKALFPAVSKVRSSGCVRWGRVKSGSSRKKKWKHARLQGAQRREGVCVGLGCRGPECEFADFLRCSKSDLGTIGDGAPPQDVWHRLWSLNTPGSPPTKFGPNVTVCNRHLGPLFPFCGRLIGIPTPLCYCRARVPFRPFRFHERKG